MKMIPAFYILTPRAMLVALTLGSAPLAQAATYTYLNNSITQTDLWSTGTNWAGGISPLGATDTRLTFINTTTPADNTSGSATFTGTRSIIASNDLPSQPFQLNILDLNGLNPTSASSLTIQGGTLKFVNNGVTTPTVNLNATGANLTYRVLSNIQLDSNTTFTGNGSATFQIGNSAGTFYDAGATITGSSALIKSGSSTLRFMGNQQGTTTAGLFAGNVNLLAGTVSIDRAFSTTGLLSLTGNASLTGGSYIGVSKLEGSSTTDINVARLYVNYNGKDVDVYNGNMGTSGSILKNGSGVLQIGAIKGGVSNIYAGTLITTGFTGASSFTTLGISTTRITGTSGVVTGSGVANVVMQGGMLELAPSGSGADISVSGTNTGFGGISIQGGYLYLNKGANNSLTFTLPSLMRNGGAVAISASGGINNLGSATGSRILFTTAPLLNTASATAFSTFTTGNNAAFVSPWVIGQDTNADQSGHFLTYNATDGLTKAGYVAALDAGSSVTAASNVVNLTGATTVSANSSAYALKTEAAVSINASQSLTVGTGAANTQAGLILNGGSVSGAGTLAFGAANIQAYVSNSNGSITSAISGTGGMTVFGPGVLNFRPIGNFGSNAISVISGATLDVGTMTSTTAVTTGVTSLKSGVLQGNGTFSANLQAAGGVQIVGSGGFAARGGNLIVKLNNLNGGIPLVWGIGNGVFVNDGGVLMFGSATADSQVDFQNNIDLGTIFANVSPLLPVAANTAATLAYSRVINVADNVNSTTDIAKISGVISSSTSEAAGIVKDGNGTLILSGVNTYRGSTTVSNGTLSISSDSNLGTAPTSLNPTPGTNGNGALILNGGTVQITQNMTLNTNRGIAVGSGVGNVEVASGVTLNYDGQIVNQFSEAGKLSKRGAGTLILGGVGTYTGGTSIDAGTLKVNGTISGPTTVQSGGTLNGSGTVGAVTVNASGTLSGTLHTGAISGAGLVGPGNSPGILTASQVDPSGGLDFTFEFTGMSPDFSNSIASVNDILRITDPTTPFSASLSSINTITVNFEVLSITLGDTFTGGFFTDLNSSFTSSIAGATYIFQFNGGSLPIDVTGFAVSTVSVTADFDGAGPNLGVDGYVMQFVAVPEPGANALLITGAGLLWMMRRKRRFV